MVCSQGYSLQWRPIFSPFVTDFRSNLRVEQPLECIKGQFSLQNDVCSSPAHQQTSGSSRESFLQPLQSAKHRNFFAYKNKF